MWIVHLIFGNIVPMSHASLVVVPNEPYKPKEVARHCVNYEADADPGEELPHPVGTGYQAEAVVLQNRETRNAGNDH